jgi:hypothetical protein
LADFADLAHALRSTGSEICVAVKLPANPADASGSEARWQALDICNPNHFALLMASVPTLARGPAGAAPVLLLDLLLMIKVIMLGLANSDTMALRNGEAPGPSMQPLPGQTSSSASDYAKTHSEFGNESVNSAGMRLIGLLEDVSNGGAERHADSHSLDGSFDGDDDVGGLPLSAADCQLADSILSGMHFHAPKP